jgi:hypothetical protein
MFLNDNTATARILANDDRPAEAAKRDNRTRTGALISSGPDTVGLPWLHFLASDAIQCLQHWAEQVGECRVAGEEETGPELEMTATQNGSVVYMRAPLAQVQSGSAGLVVEVSSDKGITGTVRIDDPRVISLLERAVKIAGCFGFQDDPNWGAPLRLLLGTALREMLASGVLRKADLQLAEKSPSVTQALRVVSKDDGHKGHAPGLR